MPLSSLSAVAVTLAVTTNIANPSGGVLLQDGATVQGHVLSAAAGDVVLLLGQDDPAENGFWLPVEGGADRDVNLGGGKYIDGKDGYDQQFKVTVTAGTNAGKTYYLATPVPVLFEDGLQFLELLADSPTVPSSVFSNTAPGQRS